MHPLVDAFWQGRQKFKKGTGKYFDSTRKPKAACHLGALYWGMYKEIPGEGKLVLLNNDWPEISKPAAVPCEHKDETPIGDISGILIHLNDEHDGRSWPDKKVAEWLETALKEDILANPSQI